MDEINEKLIHLHHCRGVGWKTIYNFIKQDPSLEQIYDYNDNDLTSLFNLPKSSSKYTLQDLHSDRIHEQIRQYRNNDITPITLLDDLYPPLLKLIYDPPWVLYAKGNIEWLKDRRALAVVGSREASNYGIKAIKMILPKLINRNLMIVSGLARGIDGIAHTETIKMGGKTIGVIAGGLYHMYPPENKNLYIKMMKDHLVLSEYPPNEKPSRWQFPYRNRIISGMSLGTFVIEAKKRSGSLITANFAVQEGREVFALPGNIDSPNSIGTNDWIQQGAKLVQSAEDILEELLI